jgi:hypothetical protein
MRIRGRLVLLIIIPLIATFTAATVAAIDLTRKASRAAQTAQAVEVAGRVGAIIRDSSGSDCSPPAFLGTT